MPPTPFKHMNMTMTPWKVAAIGEKMVPWFLVLPDDASVADLTRAVEARQNKLLQDDATVSKITVGIQLKVDGELYAVDPDDLLLNLVPKDTKGATFVAVRAGDELARCRADAAAAPAAAAASHNREAKASSSKRLQQPSNSNRVSRAPPAGLGTATVVAKKRKLPATAPADGSARSAPAERSRKSRGIEIEAGADCCGACRKPLAPNRRPNFCCRVCNELFHANCVGYNTRKRQFPPPDWICSRCPNGERGPSTASLHRSLTDMGTVRQRLGNQQWCPICLDDNRTPGAFTMGDGIKRCLGCGLQAHAHCRTEDGPDGSWACDECKRRKDGVVPGDNNPVWVRLKAARMEGGFRLSGGAPSTTPAAPAAAVAESWGFGDGILPEAAAAPAAAAAVAGSTSFGNGTLSEAAVTPNPPSAPLAVSNYRSQVLSDAEEAAAATAAVAAEAASFCPPQINPAFLAFLASAPASASAMNSAEATAVPSSPLSPPLLAAAGTPAVPGPSPVAASPTATAAAPTIKQEDEAESDRNGADADEDGIRLYSHRYPKRSKVVTPERPHPRGLPEFRHDFDWQPAENTVLAPIMLHGTPEQQRQALEFISTRLNKTTPEAREALVEKLKATVKHDDEGTWVQRVKLVDICSSDEDLVSYLLGANTQDSSRRVVNKFKILANFSSWPGSRSQLYTHAEDFDTSRYFVLRE